jgi:hypothetical protein
MRSTSETAIWRFLTKADSVYRIARSANLCDRRELVAAHAETLRARIEQKQNPPFGSWRHADRALVLAKQGPHPEGSLLGPERLPDGAHHRERFEEIDWDRDKGDLPSRRLGFGSSR